MSIIKNHTLSYFDYKQGKLTSVKNEFWASYSDDKGIKSMLDDIVKPENEEKLISEILKLNVYYNTLNIQRQASENLRFGDIFFREKNGSYLLCITAHCDCLFPKENIKNNFFFIIGEKADSTELVKKGDDVFCSYINDKSSIVAIKWNPRPVIIKITDPKIVEGNLTGYDGLEEEYKLIYKSTIKENYTQRMANNSFAHAMRVGIDFASFK